MVANTDGEGTRHGLEARQDAGTPLPGRAERAASNDAANAIRSDHACGHADGKTDLTCNPWEKFR